MNCSPAISWISTTPAATTFLDRTAHEQAAALRTGEVTSRALTEAALARVRAQEPALNAYITLMDDEALAQADQADRRIAAGNASPLTGIPIGVKEHESGEAAANREKLGHLTGLTALRFTGKLLAKSTASGLRTCPTR